MLISLIFDRSSLRVEKFVPPEDSDTFTNSAVSDQTAPLGPRSSLTCVCIFGFGLHDFLYLSEHSGKVQFYLIITPLTITQFSIYM